MDAMKQCLVAALKLHFRVSQPRQSTINASRKPRQNNKGEFLEIHKQGRMRWDKMFSSCRLSPDTVQTQDADFYIYSQISHFLSSTVTF